VDIDGPSPAKPPAAAGAVVVLDATADRTAALRWCNRIRQILLDGSATVVICDVARISGSAAEIVDSLTRLQLTAIRCGGAIRLRGAEPSLLALFELLGLADVVPTVEPTDEPPTVPWCRPWCRSSARGGPCSPPSPPTR
jgi:hypothetical protein